MVVLVETDAREVSLEPMATEQKGVFQQ